ncbi:MAG TPA: hypothetical protein VGK10_05190 [Prolixibacteraceae bacterium]|jgi:hypothetical protein
MKLKKLVLISGILFFISGCGDFFMICSLNHFYLEKDVTLAPEIEGSWTVHPLRAKSDTTEDQSSIWQLADTTSIWQIKQFFSEEKVKTKRGQDSIVFKPQNHYVVKLTGQHPDSIRYQYRLDLFRIKGNLYADFCAYESPAIKGSRVEKENYLTVHTLARVRIHNKQLNVSWLGSEYMRDMIEKKHVRIKYHYVQDAQRLLLTASSEELTNMIERYADQTRFIDWQDQPAMLQLTPINPLP